MVKKIIAVECDPESFQYDVYYNEDDACNDLFTAKGGRDYGCNRDLWDKGLKLMENIASDDEHIVVMNDEYNSKEDNDTERLDNAKQLISWFIHEQSAQYADIIQKDLTDEIYWKIINLSNKYYNSTMNDADTLVELFELIYNREFQTGEMHGCCQGDWMEYVCPKSLDSKYLDYIEAVLFGTGTEYQISEKPIEVVDEDGNPRDLDDMIDEIDGPCGYTALWKNDDIKAWIAQETSYGDVQYTKDDVLLVKISATHYTKSFSYTAEE